MKKFVIVAIVAILAPAFMFAKSTFHSIKAVSSPDNPGVLNIQSEYKSVDDQGNVITDSDTKNYRIGDDEFYQITTPDNSAQIQINTTNKSNRQAKKQQNTGFQNFIPFEEDDFFTEMQADFERNMREFDAFFNNNFTQPQQIQNSQQKQIKKQVQKSPSESRGQEQIQPKQKQNPNNSNYNPQNKQKNKKAEYNHNYYNNSNRGNQDYQNSYSKPSKKGHKKYNPMQKGVKKMINNLERMFDL